MEFKKVVELKNLKQFIKKFSKMTSLYITLFDLNHEPLSKPMGKRSFCVNLKDTSMGIYCGRSNIQGLKRAYNNKKPDIYTCYSGLTDIVIPIFIKARIVGAVVTGQLIINNGNSIDTHVQHLENLIEKHNIGQEKARELRQNLLEVPCFSKQNVMDIINMLSFTISYIISVEKEKMKYEEISTEYDHLKKILKSKEYIEKNYYDSTLNLKILASLAHMEKKYFIKVFKEIDGNTPGEYIIQTKINAAMDMLQNDNDLRIEELAENVGYDVSQFSKVFKKKVGMNPSEYKKSLRKFSGK